MTKLWAAITEALQAGEINSIIVGPDHYEIIIPIPRIAEAKPERKPRKPRQALGSRSAPAAPPPTAGAPATGNGTSESSDDAGEIPEGLRRT